jgi:SagB-type dehydrogenase family enzyme
MLLRASKTIVTIPSKLGVICHDFLTKVSIECDAETLYWLSCFHKWSNPQQIADNHPDRDRDNLLQQISDLRNVGLLMAKGSKTAARQSSFRRTWKFGLSSALLHNTCTDNDYISLAESASRQELTLQKASPPQLFKRSDRKERAIGFNQPTKIPDLLHLMAARRTNRLAQPTPLDRDQLLDCLFAGLGITAFTKTVAGVLPFKMTPSGGARNPFEAYVLITNVKDMAPGFYHFSASECVLTPVSASPKEISPVALLAGQDWAEEKPAIIFLVAVFERSMWKYRDDNAYRVVLIEAGHVAQNMILAATAHGLAGCPTAALGHSTITACLDLDCDQQTPIYAISLSHPQPYADLMVPNDELPMHLQKSLTRQTTVLAARKDNSSTERLVSVTNH